MNVQSFVRLKLMNLLCHPPGIQLLVLAGRISDAMKLVERTYPGLLQMNPELLFKLKCRQFVEMIAGCDRGEPVSLEPRLSCHSELSVSNPVSPSQQTTPTATSYIQSRDSPEAEQGQDFVMNGGDADVDEAIAMEVDSPLTPSSWEEADGVDLDHNPVDIERVLAFGRDLQSLFSQVTVDKPDDKLKSMLHVSCV